MQFVWLWPLPESSWAWKLLLAFWGEIKNARSNFFRVAARTSLHASDICIFIHKFQLSSVFFSACRADLQNIRDECLAVFCLRLFASLSHSALIYLEVHEEIFNEITSCLCVSDVGLSFFFFLFPLFFCLPNLKVYSAEIWIHKTAIFGFCSWLNVKHDELEKKESKGIAGREQPAHPYWKHIKHKEEEYKFIIMCAFAIIFDFLFGFNFAIGSVALSLSSRARYLC
jgi:hypothetical protein